MNVTKYPIAITTDAGGDFTVTQRVEDGMLSQIRYVPDGSNPLDTGADLTITDAVSGLQYYTHSNIGTSAFQRLPRHLIADAADGSVSTTLYDFIMTKGALTVTIANGGNTLSGTLYIWISH